MSSSLIWHGGDPRMPSFFRACGRRNQRESVMDKASGVPSEIESALKRYVEIQHEEQRLKQEKTDAAGGDQSIHGRGRRRSTGIQSSTRRR